jgi:NAD(P)-dependent dehydrogenase (short-subunit alcohol dehydrogenase family)
MTSKVVLITGTSSGIGREAALAAARDGWTVVATMRDPDRGDGLRDEARQAGLEIDVRRLDVTDASHVGSTVEKVMRDHGRLDALVNNAGAGYVGTIEDVPLDDVREVMEVNFFGVVAATKAAFPHLRAVGGRLVTVSSVGGVVGQPFNEAYCAAKFAVEGFMESLHPVAARVGVAVCVVEPGAVASRFAANVGIDPEAIAAAEGSYGDMMRAYYARTRATFDTVAQTPSEAAAVVVEALTDPSPRLRVQTSDQARAFVGVKLADLDGSAVTGLTSGWIADARTP